MRLSTNQKQLFDVCFVRTSVFVFGEAAHVIIVSVLNACFVVARMAQGPQPSRDKDKKRCPYYSARHLANLKLGMLPTPRLSWLLLQHRQQAL